MTVPDSVLPLRDALIERWFDLDTDNHETITDEQILARIEDLVGEGWHHAGKELERVERLRSLLRRAFAYPRFLSIGSMNNTVEVRVGCEMYDEIRAATGEPVSAGSDG